MSAGRTDRVYLHTSIGFGLGAFTGHGHAADAIETGVRSDAVQPLICPLVSSTSAVRSVSGLCSLAELRLDQYL
jgi:hypothetical protein